MARYTVIKWDNDGRRIERDADDLAEALAHAKACRTIQNRTVKVGHLGNTLHHWTRSTGSTRNHWSARATADEWFV
jgi:hypothetical protein